MRGIIQILNLDKKLDSRTWLVFQQLQRSYNILIAFSAFIGGLSLAALTFNEFNPTQSSLSRASEGLLCSSALTSIISVMLFTMLLFYFDGHKMATRRELLPAWSPLPLLDLAIVKYLIGLLLWYSGKNNRWRTALISVQLAVLLLYSTWIALWMWQTTSKKGSLRGEGKLA